MKSEKPVGEGGEGGERDCFNSRLLFWSSNSTSHPADIPESMVHEISQFPCPVDLLFTSKTFCLSVIAPFLTSVIPHPKYTVLEQGCPQLFK